MRALTRVQGAVTAIAAAMGTWKGYNKGHKVGDVTYLAPYWLPLGHWLPFEMMGFFRGAIECMPRLPPFEPQESQALWDASEDLCAAYL